MIDEVKVRARKSAKHGKTYEYRFEVAPIGGERKWYSKGGFLSEKEARKAGLPYLIRYGDDQSTGSTPMVNMTVSVAVAAPESLKK